MYTTAYVYKYIKMYKLQNFNHLFSKLKFERNLEINIINTLSVYVFKISSSWVLTILWFSIIIAAILNLEIFWNYLIIFFFFSKTILPWCKFTRKMFSMIKWKCIDMFLVSWRWKQNSIGIGKQLSKILHLEISWHHMTTFFLFKSYTPIK